jgi:hypothetical protein
MSLPLPPPGLLMWIMDPEPGILVTPSVAHAGQVPIDAVVVQSSSVTGAALIPAVSVAVAAQAIPSSPSPPSAILLTQQQPDGPPDPRAAIMLPQPPRGPPDSPHAVLLQQAPPGPPPGPRPLASSVSGVMVGGLEGMVARLPLLQLPLWAYGPQESSLPFAQNPRMPPHRTSPGTPPCPPWYPYAALPGLPPPWSPDDVPPLPHDSWDWILPPPMDLVWDREPWFESESPSPTPSWDGSDRTVTPPPPPPSGDDTAEWTVEWVD